MRYVCQFSAAVLAACLLLPAEALGQGNQGLSITNYQFVSEQRYSRTQSYITYRADLVNTGPARSGVTATVTSSSAGAATVPGQTNLHFAPVPTGSQVSSSNTFTLFVDRSLPFDFSSLSWSFTAPVANAGPNQTVAVGTAVLLNGSGSTNPSGVGTLSYAWTFVSRPPGTATKLQGSDSVNPVFAVDVPGNYIISLTVSNGAGTDTATVTVSTVNSPPVANAGANQTVPLGALVTLSGAGSYDVDGDPLTYSWTLISAPAQSAAILTGATTVTPSFVADKAGSYVIQLIVNDGKVNSAPASVQITTQNTAPVAKTGPNQVVSLGAVVQLDGSGSTDVDGDPITYQWSLITLPSGSTATLSSVTAVKPTFVADKPGTYVVQLIVNDGKVNSSPVTVTITTNTIQPPTANAGQGQTVVHGSTVTLSGSGTDPQGLPLTYAWSFTTKPPNSAAVLSSPTVAKPTFIADQPGSYIVQLIVSNAYSSSLPATVTITTTNTKPVANAGPGQSVTVGAIVTLNGNGSFDADGDPLKYSWSFLSKPTGSSAVLSAPATSSPTFVPDVAGTYVVQLIVNDGFVNSDPVTVTITAGLNSITLTPVPLNLATNSSGTIKVTLGSPAGAGGVVITLASSDSTVASVPSPATVLPGTSTVDVAVTTGAAGTALILATSPGWTPGSVTANVTVPSISVTLDQQTIGITKMANGTVTLSSPPPPGGLLVTLSASPNGVVSLQPATLNLTNTVTGSFTATGVSAGTATINASAAGYSSGAVTVNVGKLGAIKLPVNITVGPSSSTPYAISLVSPAPVGGVTITLQNSDPTVATLPASVFIAQGATTPAVQPQITGVKFGSVTITAAAPGFDGDSQTARVTATLSFTPPTLTVGTGGSASLTLTLSSPAPSGLSIDLSSSNTAAATVPASIPFPAGTTTLTIPVTALAQGTAIVHASSLPNLADTTASVSVALLGAITLPQNASVGVNQSVAFPISLSAAAPAGGTTVTITPGDPAALTFTPASVFIPAGQTAPGSQPQMTGKTAGSVGVTATAAGYTTATASVSVGTALSFAQQNNTITAGSTQNITLNLSATTAVPLTVTLTSDNTGVVTVPASVTIPANSNSVPVPVTAITPGSTAIHASATNAASAAANVTVQSAGTISVPANVTVPLGQSAPFAVTLAAPASSNVTISLTSSDTSKVTIAPSSISIASGATAPAAQPQITGVSIGTVTVSASAPGFSSGSGTAGVSASLSFPTPNLTVSAGGTQSITLQLSSVTPVALTVTLSSDNTSTATVPASATIPANASSVSFLVTGVAAGATAIHATGPANVTAAAANITVQGTDILLPSNVSLAPGDQAAFPVTLAQPAPASGVFIQLSSSDPSKVTLTQTTVIIAAGQTQPSSTPKVVGVDLGSATITASAGGQLASSSKTVTVGSVLSLSPNPISASPSTTLQLTISMTGTAPASGLTVNLVSSNPGVASVPGSVLIPAGQTLASFQMTAGSAGSATITASASAANVTGASAPVTVGTTGALVLPSGVTVAIGQTINFPVTLTSPAPANGVTVALTASNTDAVFLAPNCIGTPCAPNLVTQRSVFIAAGQTTPQTQPQITGYAPGPLTITASAPGYTGASTGVQVQASFAFSPQTLTINGATTGQLLLVLSGPAPAPPTGIPVTLTSSNPGVATVAQTVTFYWDGSSPTTLNITVQGVAAGTTTIRASAAFMSDATATVNVIGPVAITTAALPQGVQGQNYSASLAASGGTPPYTFTATGLPGTLTINGTTGQISGVPAATGTSTVTFTVTDSSTTHQTASASLSLSIVAGIAITTTSLPSGIQGQPYSTTVSASGGVTPFNWAATGLPAGLGMNSSTGQITGTPNAAFTGPVTITVTDSTNPAHQSATANLSLTVVGPLSISTTSLPAAVQGQAYTATVSGAGGTTPYTWAASGLPSGLSINTSTGQITGNTNVLGTANVAITAIDSTSPVHQTQTVTLTLAVVPPLSVASTSLPDGTLGSVYSTVLNASGGTSPYTWSLTGLPNGLTFNASTGRITGNPTAAGTSPIAITVTDSTLPAHFTSSATLNLLVTGPLAISTTTLPTGVTGTPYAATVTAAGGATPYSWVAAGLPGGFAINASTGQITGTPSTTGSVSITVSVTDFTNPSHQTVSGNLTLTFIAPVTITTASLPGGTKNAAYSASVAASGGTGPYTWTATGLPAGLGINSSTGQITGTPSASGTNTAVITVTDSTNPTHLTASVNLPITIADVLSIPATTLPGGVQGTAYSASVSASGGTGPYVWSATGLPSGLSMSSGGQITGTPGAAGTSTVVVNVTDSSPTQQSATANLSLTILAPLTVTTATLPSGTQGVPYTATVNATGGTTPYSWAATGLPAGLSMGTSGQITGTPTVQGSFNPVITVTDSGSPAHLTTTVNRTLTIGAPSAATMAAVAGNGQSTIAGTPFPAQLVVEVRDGGNNVMGGVGVLFTAPATGPGLTFAGGSTATTVITNSLGRATAPAMTANGAAGTYSVVASIPAAPGVAPVSFTLTNNPVPSLGTLSVSSANVGQNLQSSVTVSLPAASASDVVVTLTSADPSKVKLGGAGLTSVQLTIPAGQTQVSVFVQGQGQPNLGAVTLSATAQGYTTGTGTVNLTPSAFVLGGPNDVKGSFQVFKGVITPITVYSARLDNSGNYVEKQPLRSASSSVPIQLSSTAGGTLNVSSVTFAGGDSSANFTFQGTSTGSITISASTPAGFTPPIDGSNTLNVTVVASGLVPDSLTVGNNLENTAVVTLNGQSSSSLQMTISVDSASIGKFKLATTATAVGADTITLTLPANARHSPQFYVFGHASSGTGTYTAMATGFGSAQGTVTLAPSAVLFATGLGQPTNLIITTAAAGPSAINVFAATLTSTGDLSAVQAISGDAQSATAAIANSNPAAGSVPSSVTLTAGVANATILFQPLATGDTTLTIGVPPSPGGFSTPSAQFRSQAISVRTPGIACGASGALIGVDLQIQDSCFLGQAAPSGGLTVTISATGLLKVAVQATDSGSSAITITVPAGQSSFKYYLQAFGSSGTETFTVRAPGYTDRSGTVSLTPSSIVLSGAGGLSLASVPSTQSATVGVYTARLNPDTSFAEVQQLRGGLTVTAPLLSSATGIVTVDSPVTLVGGADPSTPVTTLIHGISAGSATITVSQSGNFVPSAAGIFNPASTLLVSVN